MRLTLCLIYSRVIGEAWIIPFIMTYIAVTTFGIKLMKNRKAFNIRWILIAFNAAQIALSLFLLMKVSHRVGFKTFNLRNILGSNLSPN